MRIWVGIDNGVSGTIGVISEKNKYSFIFTPTKKELSYTKEKQFISRIDYPILLNFLKNISKDNEVTFLLERPMVNPQRFKASVSALRALEATLIVIEEVNGKVIYVDSKQWQKELLPKGISGDELKKASMDIGSRLFPIFKKEIIKHKDADGLLIAEFGRRHLL